MGDYLYGHKGHGLRWVCKDIRDAKRAVEINAGGAAKAAKKGRVQKQVWGCQKMVVVVSLVCWHGDMAVATVEMGGAMSC